MNIFTSLFTDHKHPVPPIWFHADKPMWQRRVLWWSRNPFADFTSFYIGIKGREFTTTGRVSQKIDGLIIYPTFNPDSGVQWLIHKTRYFVFPFISYASKGFRFKTYIGWRPSGAFGLKLQVHRK